MQPNALRAAAKRRKTHQRLRILSGSAAGEPTLGPPLAYCAHCATETQHLNAYPLHAQHGEGGGSEEDGRESSVDRIQ